jgi:hypothetical protein
VNAILFVLTALAVLAVAPEFGQTPDSSRQQIVRQRSADARPFDMNATTHVFTETPTGGTQRVVVRSPGDTEQTALIRRHLRDIADRFARRDFGAAADVHGAAMPGLALLKSADPGDLRVRYRDIQTGAEIQYSSSNPKVVWALHAQTYPIWKCPTHSIDSSRYTDASNTTGRVKSRAPQGCSHLLRGPLLREMSNHGECSGPSCSGSDGG